MFNMSTTASNTNLGVRANGIGVLERRLYGWRDTLKELQIWVRSIVKSGHKQQMAFG